MSAIDGQPTVVAPQFELLEPVERGPAQRFLEAHPAGVGAPLAVVIPAFNEEPTVADVIASIPAEAAGLQTETIVVVDGARDRTAEAATRAGALVCDVPVNRGQGAALRLGYWLARARGAQVIATIDADGQYEPEEIGRRRARAASVSGLGAADLGRPARLPAGRGADDDA
jgi:glycosyltransferase involved in cell wall biosynthesis